MQAVVLVLFMTSYIGSLGDELATVRQILPRQHDGGKLTVAIPVETSGGRAISLVQGDERLPVPVVHPQG